MGGVKGRGLQVKTFTLSAHAEVVMAERSIRREWLEKVLAHPELIEADRDDPQITHALGRISEHGGRVLRVVFNGTSKPANDVTVYFDRAIKGKL